MNLGGLQARHATLSTELSAERQALISATATAGDLEARVSQGDASVSALGLLEARHACELAQRRINQLEVDLRAAQDALADAEADALIAEWAVEAPRQRAQIKAAAEKVAAAAEELRETVNSHNAAQEATRRQFMNGRHDRKDVTVWGFARVGSERLRPINAEDVLFASLNRNVHLDLPALHPDVLVDGHIGRRPRPTGPARVLPPAHVAAMPDRPALEPYAGLTRTDLVPPPAPKGE